MRDKVSVMKVKHPRYKLVVAFPGHDKNGKPIRRKNYFATKEQANAFAAELRAKLASHGARHAHVADDERAALIRFRTWAESRDEPVKLLDLINEAITARERVAVTATVQDLIDARITHAQRKGSAKRHIEDLESRLNRFAKVFGKRNAANVTSSDIEQWIHKTTSNAVTFGNFMRAINSVFTLALKQGKVRENPVSRIEAPKVVRSAPKVLKPTELHALLTAASQRLRPLLVLQAFAGVRRAEAERLTWAHIHLDTQEPCVELPSEITKTNRRRSVSMPVNAVAWLKALPRDQEGPLGLSASAYRDDLTQAAKTAKITWDENLLRHSYGSYRLAQTKNAAQVAEEMGNSPQVVRTHYQNLVRPEAVADYWKITPERISSKVLSFKAGRARKAS